MEAKEETNLAEEKEQIQLAYINELNKNKITAQNLKEELEKNGISVIKITGTETFHIILENNRKYRIYADGTVEYMGIENLELTDIYVTLYDNGTLVFSSISEKDEEGILKEYGNIKNLEFTSDDLIPWFNETSSITKVCFENEIIPQSTMRWFAYCSNLVTIEKIYNLNTSQVTSMRSMFFECNSLMNIDVGNFETSKVTSMRGMFYGCESLTNIDVNVFDTHLVTDMLYMFYRCTSLINIDLSTLDTSNVTNMSFMFYRCSKLTTLDLSSLDTSKVTDMSHMFSHCESLTSLDLSNFDTSNVTDMTEMFSYCRNLANVAISTFSTDNVTSMWAMFLECQNLTSLDLTNFNTSKVTNMRSMFNLCSNLTSLDLSSFNTTNVTDMSYMFYKCSNLGIIYAGDNWNICSNAEEIFTNCKSSTVTYK